MKYDGGDGQISYSNFRKISREFPFLLHPAFRLQEKFMTEVRMMPASGASADECSNFPNVPTPSITPPATVHHPPLVHR